MNSMPEDLPDDPQLLKQMLAKMQSRVGFLEEENALLRSDCLNASPSKQLILPRLSWPFSTRRKALPSLSAKMLKKRSSHSTNAVVNVSHCLPICRLHELPEHELTCVCGCRKHAIGEEISEQLEIMPMQIRVIKHVRKVYGCRDCETAPITADKPAQLIEKGMASPSALAMLLTTKYVDGLPLHRF